MSTEPNKKLLGDPRVLRITLDDQDWPIPKLAPAQLEVVLPLIDSTLATIGGKALGSGSFTKELLHDLGTILYLGLERGHPSLTREEFDQMPIGLTDLVDGMAVVQRQCGMFRPTKPSEVNVVSAPLAVTAASSQTG
jgi:hypothetical protein